MFRSGFAEIDSEATKNVYNVERTGKDLVGPVGRYSKLSTGFLLVK